MLAVGLAVVGSTGCYTYRPGMAATPMPGQQVALELGDQGRVASSDRLGPGVLRVEGTLVGVDSATYHLRVARVTYLNAPAARWGGEAVQLARTDVVRVLERRLSRERTFVAAGAAAALIGGFIATRTLSGSGKDPSGKNPGQGTGEQ